MKKARLVDNKIILTFNKMSKNEFQKIYKTISQLPMNERKYLSNTKEWEVVCTEKNYDIIRGLNFDIPNTLYVKMNHLEDTEEWRELEIPEDYLYLFDYQRECLRFSMYNNHRTLISLDVGLGKTATALAVIDTVLNDKDMPVILVVPSLIKKQWKKEYHKFIKHDDRIKIIEKSSGLIDYKDTEDIIIVNYELLARNMGKLDKQGKCYPNEKMIEFKKNYPSLIVLDEVQFIKNNFSKTKNAVEYLCQGTPHIVGLTGTPIKSSSGDLFPILNILNKEMFPNYYSFLNRYAYSKINYRAGGIKQWYGSRNSAELHNILKSEIMFRRTKEDVGRVTDKPIQTVLPIPLKDYKEYEKLKKALNQVDERKSGIGIFNEMRELAWEQKKESVFSFIDGMLAESSDKIVIFAVNKKVISNLMEQYGKIAVKIDGSVSTQDGVRDTIIDKFVKNEKVRVFIGSITAAGTGLNGLQFKSSTMIFLQWTWVPSDIWQCIGRLDRLGQEKIVNIYHLSGEDTIEEIFMRVLDKKSQTFKEVVDGVDFEEEDMLQVMLEEAKMGEG